MNLRICYMPFVDIAKYLLCTAKYIHQNDDSIPSLDYHYSFPDSVRFYNFQYKRGSFLDTYFSVRIW